MQTLRDSVRNKVDEMRASGYLQNHNRGDVVAELARTAQTVAAADEAGVRGGPIHKCPWHTCAATRHG